MQRFLIIRFSSIGDIVLTTPVIRSLKNKFPNAEIHFLTKTSFRSVVESNPYLSKVWTIEKEVTEVLEDLKQQGFDYVLDLHKNIRSKKVVRALGKPSTSVEKLNVKKWLLTNFKMNKMPDVHIVDRYLDAGKNLELENDGEGLNYFLTPEDAIENPFESYGVFVVGAAHATKAMTIAKSIEILSKIESPMVLIGGPADKSKAEEILSQLDQKKIKNLAGECSLGQSATLLKNSSFVITPDTGMMHIASAFNRPVISVWGNTVPEFGMYGYIPKQKDHVYIVEVKDLSCRPCSKIGYKSCPKKHFKCIEDIDVERVVEIVRSYT